MKNKIKAVIFDMDGVLIEAKEWHYDALNRALEFYNYTPISRRDHLLKYDGLSTKKKLLMHFQTKNADDEIRNKINQKKQEYTNKLIEKKCVKYQTHIDLLQYLKNSEYKMAVCSNSIRNTVETILTKSSIIEYFDFFLSNEDVKNPKPDSEIYVEAIKKMGLEADEVLICEDNIQGIKSAMDSGAFVLEINSIEDVNLENIKNTIEKIESDKITDRLIRGSVRVAKLSEMVGGWFVGDFYPNILSSKDFEVAVKKYKKGDIENEHVHKEATEITVILNGIVMMRGNKYYDGDIILLEPHNSTAFEAITDVTTVVVKTPSAIGDKYIL